MRKRTSVIVKIIFLIGLLTMSTPLNESKAESNQTTTVKMGNRTVERPSKRYPLGVASDATMFAGKNMILNPNNVGNSYGEFYAGHFLVGSSINDTEDTNMYPNITLNHFEGTDIDLPSNLDPSIVSASPFSDAMVKVISNSKSLINIDGSPLHYVMGESSKDIISDEHLKQIFPWDSESIDTFKKRAEKDTYLGNIGYFKENKVSTDEQAISNVTNVSDYYANLTATEYDADGNITGYKQSIYSDAIKSVGLNSKTVSGGGLNSHIPGDVIQVNVDMNTASNETGVAVVDIDGAANDGVFQKATGISINLLNFTQGKQKVPYIIFNFHNFKSFNFGNSSTYSMSAYTPAQVQAQAPDNNKYYPQDYASYEKRLNLTPADDNSARYKTASHVLNNFNTLSGNGDAAITLNSNRSNEDSYSFIGTVLAPHTNIIVEGDHRYSFAGNVITNNDIYLDGQVDLDKAFGANFNSDGGFPGTSDLEPTTEVPRILSVDLPNSVNFSPENTTTNYVFEYSLNNNTAIDPPSSTMHKLDGRAFSNTFKIDEPAGTDNVLWYQMNGKKWKAYKPDGNNPLQPNTTSESKTVELSIADVTEDLKTNDDSDYDDRTVYNGGEISGNYEVKDDLNPDKTIKKAFMGWHLLHKNKFSFVVASASDNLATMSADQIKAKYDNAIVNYTLNVHGDLLVNYPKVFDFGTYQLGTSGKNPESIAKGQINVENPFYMNWRVDVMNTTENDGNNPLLQKHTTDFNVQLYSLETGIDDTWKPGKMVNLGDLLKDPKEPLLTLDTDPKNTVDDQLKELQPTRMMPFYKSDVNLKFHNAKANQLAHTGKFNIDVTWKLSTTDPVVPNDK
ncbi:hypothetical protein [Latilactobacillus curvatus]|uniref:hypothetical protein n=1 Tax=Latilactobacillus curvatus TaxID=28038 RepID=UPI0021A92B0C|nr:hypothetical protein [Latilactobacillus curvatus]